MSSTPQVSFAICRQLQRLRSLWLDWEGLQDVYIEEVFPALLDGTAKSANREEREILATLRRITTPAEREALPQILATLDKQMANASRRRRRAATHSLSSLGQSFSLEEYRQRRAQAAQKPAPALPSSKNNHGHKPRPQQTPPTPQERYPAADWLHQKFGVQLTHEQAQAVTSAAPATLVKARAGSGKTGVLIAKVAWILHHEQLNPENILIAAFNDSAAVEIRDRLAATYGLENFTTARTFHSLANRLVDDPDYTLLAENTGPRSRDEAVRAAMWQVWDRQMMVDIYLFFYREITEEPTDGPPDDDTLQFTLRAEVVKSRGEKYIADFLLANSIDYAYEQPHGWNGTTYRPDFTIFLPNQKRAIIEHWAIDPHDKQARLPANWEKNTETYRQEIQQKRAYWQQRGIPLIETSTADLRHGRKAFEKRLRAKLRGQHIECRPLSPAQWEEHILTWSKDRLTTLFVSFISRAKKANMDSRRLKKLYGSMPADERSTVFLRLVARVYAAYEEHLRENRLRDFDDLIIHAADYIEARRGDCLLNIENREIPLQDVRWLLIDEFQDLSPGFFRLIQTLRKYNPDLRIFAVGDDWQAINGFAGSDVEYFQKFTSYLPDAVQINMLTNHRSQARIVETANRLMVDLGEPARPRANRTGGQVAIRYLEDVSINFGPASAKTDAFPDIRYRISDISYTKRYQVARCLKACYALICKPEYKHKTIAILARKNNLHGVDLRRFHAKLTEHLPPHLGSQVKISTLHSYKGQEADIVILADICEGSMPLVHPDTPLYQIFARPLQDSRTLALAEEKRLFYVGLTRAKEALWILTERAHISRFLRDLSL